MSRLSRIQGARVAEALHSYLHEGGRQALAPRAESVIGDRMLKAPTLGLRIVNFRTFRSIAETPAGLQQVKDLLSGKLVVPGLTLKRLDRWELIGHLIAMGDPRPRPSWLRKRHAITAAKARSTHTPHKPERPPRKAKPGISTSIFTRRRSRKTGSRRACVRSISGSRPRSPSRI